MPSSNLGLTLVSYHPDQWCQGQSHQGLDHGQQRHHRGPDTANILGFDPAGLQGLTANAYGFERGSAAVPAPLPLAGVATTNRDQWFLHRLRSGG